MQNITNWLSQYKNLLLVGIPIFTTLIIAMINIIKALLGNKTSTLMIQNQKSGKDCINIQAGNDITIRAKSKNE